MLRKTKNTTRLVGVLAEIRTRYLLNSSQMRYWMSNSVVLTEIGSESRRMWGEAIFIILRLSTGNHSPGRTEEEHERHSG
jgi:hypothetical protein